ncbi:DNA helicase [Bertholletia excelsa]
MDSDSDSGGSHVSATPPRDLSPPVPAVVSSYQSKINLSALISLSRHTSKSKPKPKPRLQSKSKPKTHSKPEKRFSKPNPKTSRQEPSPTPIIPPDLSNLPFRICRPFDENKAVSSEDCNTNFPARGLCLSQFASFSEKQRLSLKLELIENDSTPASRSISQGAGIEAAPMKAKSEGIGDGNLTKGVRRPSNLIGGSNNLNDGNLTKVVRKPPNLISGSNNLNELSVKRPKCRSEGNFVRLNINGRARKFKFKGKRRNFAVASGRRSFRSKRKFRGGGGDETGKKEFCDEDALVLEITEVGKRPRLEKDEELIEEAVLGVRNEPSDENLLKLLKLTHGYESFRDGQLEAIKMVLSGRSTMLVLPTGAGKSLCYQLPAAVLSGIVLVVSPLVALMIDQLKQLPPTIKGSLLCSSQTPEEISETLRSIQEGSIKVLFVSPERFLNAEFTSVFSATSLISLLVVDEAHCLSEWSHNFRPSYMRLRASLLSTSLNVQCILAMTATATTKTLNDIMCALEIPPTNLIKIAQLRDNLHLMKDLMTLIKSSPITEVESIIVYCKFQSESDMISKYLCDNNILAMSYHSGIPTKERNRVQELFCLNKIRVVVATVAFGMGLDKRDVGAIVHYALPESLEEYVQEIGRAGRDGRLSYCHLLFDDNTYFKLRSLASSDGVDEFVVSRFVSQVFSTDVESQGNIRSIMKESASRKFDMKEEVMLTILTRLELGEMQYLHLLPQINATCTLNFHQTPPALLASKDIVVAAILKNSDAKNGQYVFDMPTVANCIGASTADIANHLQNLKSKREITYEMKDPAYCYIIVDVPKDFCSLSAHLTKWLSEVESSKVWKIDAMFNAASFAVRMCEKTNGCYGSQHTACLQKKILEYFNGDGGSDLPNEMENSSRFLRADIKVFLQSNAHDKFTPRAVARIMHGIPSPAYPSATWSRTHFWGRYMHVDFPVVMEVAKAELMNSIRKDII